jgi:hypothetical protein
MPEEPPKRTLFQSKQRRDMARYKEYDYSQGKFIPIHYDRQILPGTFEHSLHYLIDNEIDLFIFDARYRNDETGAPAYDPAILLKILRKHHARSTISLKPGVEAVEKVPEQTFGRDADEIDFIECATINDLILGKDQDTPEGIILTRQKDFSCRLVSHIKLPSPFSRKALTCIFP